MGRAASAGVGGSKLERVETGIRRAADRCRVFFFFREYSDLPNMSDDAKYRQHWCANSGDTLHSVCAPLTSKHHLAMVGTGECSAGAVGACIAVFCVRLKAELNQGSGFVDVVKKTVVMRKSRVREGPRMSLASKTSKKGSLKPEVGIATTAVVLAGNAVRTHRDPWTRGCVSATCVVDFLGFLLCSETQATWLLT